MPGRCYANSRNEVLALFRFPAALSDQPQVMIPLLEPQPVLPGAGYPAVKGTLQSPEKRIASSLSADGGLGSVPRQDNRLIRQNEEPVAYAGN